MTSHSNPFVCGDSVICSVISSHSTTDTAGALCRPLVKTLLPELTVNPLCQSQPVAPTGRISLPNRTTCHTAALPAHSIPTSTCTQVMKEAGAPEMPALEHDFWNCCCLHVLRQLLWFCFMSTTTVLVGCLCLGISNASSK